jgi:formamidopyrimidine-DNA glycosylase
VPELPEVETVRRGLAPVMEGARILRLEARRPDLRRPLQPDFVRRVEGETVTTLGRRAKYLLAELAAGDVLVMHLGMSGSFRVSRKADQKLTEAPDTGMGTAVHDHVVFHLSSGATVTFNDPRRFGMMLVMRRDEVAGHPLFRDIGPEPLDDGFDARRLAASCFRRNRSLKAVLLDQTVVAGLGNIYVCEALHRARLSPKRLAPSIAKPGGAPNARAFALVEAIKAVLEEAVRAGGSSLRDHRRTNGELGMFQHHFRVYGREGEPCVTPGCSGTVKRIVQNGRSTYFCPACQK